ncbi:MAG: hypothetical protein CSB44_12140 [Gammaproteobacteria bacterium]|nr:MAG: hypothetical protein CSB44_12140 [Gammaproteobacteria bacterium]
MSHDFGFVVHGSEHWSIDRMIVVHDLCQSLAEALMRCHGEEMTRRMLELDEEWREMTGEQDRNTLELPLEY